MFLQTWVKYTHVKKSCPLCPEFVLQQNLLYYTRRIVDHWAQLTGSNNWKRQRWSYIYTLCMAKLIWISKLHKYSAKVLPCSWHVSGLLMQKLGRSEVVCSVMVQCHQKNCCLLGWLAEVVCSVMVQYRRRKNWSCLLDLHFQTHLPCSSSIHWSSWRPRGSS